MPRKSTCKFSCERKSQKLWPGKIIPSFHVFRSSSPCWKSFPISLQLWRQLQNLPCPIKPCICSLYGPHYLKWKQIVGLPVCVAFCIHAKLTPWHPSLSWIHNPHQNLMFTSVLPMINRSLYISARLLSPCFRKEITLLFLKRNVCKCSGQAAPAEELHGRLHRWVLLRLIQRIAP